MSGSFSFTAIKQIQNNSTAENIKIYSSAQGVAVIEFPAVINEQITVRVISFSGQIITEKS